MMCQAGVVFPNMRPQANLLHQPNVINSPLTYHCDVRQRGFEAPKISRHEASASSTCAKNRHLSQDMQNNVWQLRRVTGAYILCVPISDVVAK
ncbi:hypothetical protein AVEN_208658-1 [Araneus ventricosus]|uniref:Uncharacterized protein n=1 Tax=Araneus ventricosus TaxID=182803 RepID=A0A4Y2DUV9_ARAVE|nr:hypothetical protein AVEN_208658-1 [Araneus ventricosus]